MSRGTRGVSGTTGQCDEQSPRRYSCLYMEHKPANHVGLGQHKAALSAAARASGPP